MAEIYKTFRGVESLANRFSLSKRFDEPTYFSFRLVFGTDSDRNYNIANNQALYDTMPHPLFNPSGRLIDPAYITTTKIPGTPVVIPNTPAYSAMQYLNDANEPTRVKMLEEFVNKFNQLQYNYPYYFQSIEGISDLLKVDSTKGQRISNDKKISITCLEGLDLRMSYLMNLYKKVAWDDVYQRWVLPDMMRYFTLKVYLAEFRTFHTANIIDGYGNGTITTINPPRVGLDPTQLIRPKNYTPTEPMDSPNSLATPPLYLKILDDILPTWEITCEMCEFDISDVTYTHLDALSVASDPQQGAVKFGVKIGNIKELQTYPVFQHKFLSDRKINGSNRAKDEISTSSESNNAYLYPASLQVAQARDAEGPLNQHVSGLPYNENKNSTSLYGQGGPGADRIWGNKDDDVKEVDPTNPDTWVGNAIQFGSAFAKNTVKKVVDKAKMTDIPGLGVSFTEIKTAIQSKDIISVLGLIRKGVNETVKSYGNAPSSRLDQPIQTDNIMREFLTTLSKSEATDDDTLALRGAANMALNDKNIWEKIKDFSMATDLVGKEEINSDNPVRESNAYKRIQKEESDYIVIPVNADFPRIDSNAASGKIKEEILNQGRASSELSGKTTAKQIDEGKASERLSSMSEGEVSEQLAASVMLDGNVGTNNVQTSASSKLGGNIVDDLEEPKPSSLLASNLSNDPDIPIASSLLSSRIQRETNQPSASELLANKLNGGEKMPEASSTLSSTIEGNKLDRPAPSSFTKKIDPAQIIEYAPTSSLNKNKSIEKTNIKQPEPGKAIENGKE
jgi:hypothetical protein